LRYWVISHGRDGFALHVQERSRLGSALAWAIENADMEWFGKYRNIPFCWINPWESTWKVGREEHTLGDKWCDAGHAVLHFAWRLQHARELIRLPLTDDQVREHFPDTWKWYAEMFEDDDEEGSEEA
jgi:hypothetical protein